MKKAIASFFACIALLFLLQSCGGDRVVRKSGVFAGTKTDYLLFLPRNWSAKKEYPTILAFCGAAQDQGTAEYTMKANWEGEAGKRGYVVIMPIAPEGRLFFEGGESIFPAFLDQMKLEHRLSGGKFHVAGRSNGGISAFRVAIAFPEFFQSLTVYPGFLLDDDLDRASRLIDMPVKMAVGELDLEWLQAGRDQSARLAALGVRVWFQVEKGCNHGIESFTGAGSARLLDFVELK